jgi:anti-anti-sigma regulatory factor
MNFRIDSFNRGQPVVILRVSGRIQAGNVDTLRGALGRQNGRVVIDLAEVALVDREAVAFLALSEIDGVELRNCPAYIREWVDREKRSER